MHPVRKTTCTIERNQHACYHRQGRRQPGGNFARTQYLVKHTYQHEISWWHRLYPMRQRGPYLYVWQSRNQHGKHFIMPKVAM